MKLSGIQVFWMMFTFVAGDLFIATMGTVIGYSKQDAWISYTIATIFGLLLVYVATKLSLLYPNQTLIEYSKTILGKWLGNIVVITYLIHWYSVIGLFLREMADFTIIMLLPSTPIWVFILTMLILAVYVTYIGIEGIGRCSEVFGLILIFAGALLVILSIPDLRFDRILPIYLDSGIRPILKGGIYATSYIGETVTLMMMITSFISKPMKGPSSAMWGISIAGFALTVASLITLMILSPGVAADLNYPALTTASFISRLGFIQNLEIIVFSIWILSVFIMISMYLFIACYGTAQFLKIKNWRKTIWFVAAFSFVYALFYPNVTISEVEYIYKFWLPFAFPIHIVGLPLLLWIIGSIRKKKQ